jgi:hypothetical protein
MGIDPDLFQIWHSSQTGKFQLNFVGYADPVSDDLILKIRQEYDLERQVAYCHQLHERIAAAQPYTFLYVNRWTACWTSASCAGSPTLRARPLSCPLCQLKPAGIPFISINGSNCLVHHPLRRRGKTRPCWRISEEARFRNW